MPAPVSYTYVLDAYDASGHYIAGSGAPGDISVDGPDVRPLTIERAYAVDGPQDRVVTLKVGPVMSVVMIDFP